MVEYVQHEAWGGKFTITRGGESFTIRLKETPRRWEAMQWLGWKRKMTLDNEDHLSYFIPWDESAKEKAPYIDVNKL